MNAEHELEYMKRVMLALGQRDDLAIWRQNTGKVAVRDRAGKVLREFNAGPPNGAADVSGFVRPEGWRFELELKSETGTRSKVQRTFARNVIAGGCVYVLARYDEVRTLDENVRHAVDLVELAIRHKRAA